MAGTYVLGETKVRPGAYFNIQKKGTGQQSGTVSGVTAVLFRSDFGPLNTAVRLQDFQIRSLGSVLEQSRADMNLCWSQYLLTR